MKSLASVLAIAVLLSCFASCEDPVTAVQDPKEIARRSAAAKTDAKSTSKKGGQALAAKATGEKSKEGKKTKKKGGLAKYDAKDLGLTLKVPGAWESKTMGDSLVFLSTKESPQDFQENLNVAKKTFDEQISTEEYYQKTLQTLRLLKDFKIKKQGDLKRKKKDPIKFLHYSYKMDGEEIAGAAYVMVEAKVGIVVAGAATKDTFKAHKKIFDKVAKSVRIARK